MSKKIASTLYKVLFVLLIATILFVTILGGYVMFLKIKKRNEAEHPSYEYQYIHYDPIKKKHQYGFMTLNDEIKKNDFKKYRNHDGKMVLISPLKSKNFYCMASCSDDKKKAEEEDVEVEKAKAEFLVAAENEEEAKKKAEEFTKEDCEEDCPCEEPCEKKEEELLPPPPPIVEEVEEVVEEVIEQPEEVIEPVEEEEEETKLYHPPLFGEDGEETSPCPHAPGGPGPGVPSGPCPFSGATEGPCERDSYQGKACQGCGLPTEFCSCEEKCKCEDEGCECLDEKDKCPCDVVLGACPCTKDVCDDCPGGFVAEECIEIKPESVTAYKCKGYCVSIQDPLQSPVSCGESTLQGFMDVEFEGDNPVEKFRKEVLDIFCVLTAQPLGMCNGGKRGKANIHCLPSIVED